MNQSTRTILCVDDEPNILSSLKRTFFETNYRILVAGSAKEALSILSNEQVDLLIADMYMPEMDGYELLEEVKNRFPQIIRLILSGYAEHQIVLKSGLNSLAKAFLPKPWSVSFLRERVFRYFELKDMLVSHDIWTQINDIEIFSLFPPATNALNGKLGALRDPARAASLIEVSPCLSINILRIANAIVYKDPISNVEMALSYLNLETVNEIFHRCGTMSIPAYEGDTYNYTAFYQHLLTTNKLTRTIYERFLKARSHSEEIKNRYSTIGLIHDIGKLLIMQRLPDVWRNISIGGQWSRDAEVKHLGIDHCELGSLLLEWFNFPDYIIDTVQYHHDPQNPDCRFPRLCALTAVADYAARDYTHAENQEPSEAVYRLAQVEKADVMELLD